MEPTILIDTHAHLSSSEFSNDFPEVLERAQRAGVSGIVVVSEDVEDARDVLALCRKHSTCLFAGCGLHPGYVSRLTDEEADKQCSIMEELLEAHSTEIAAVGEIGLDFSPRVLSSGPGDVRERQARVFRRLLNAAVRLNLPASVHSRSAGRHVLDVVANVPGAVVCMHAFDGRAVYAERALTDHPDRIFFSIPPSVVRTNSLRKLIARIRLERLLLESDAPVLGPTAEERNEPANAYRSLETIAAVKGMHVGEVSRVLLGNAMQVFQKLSITAPSGKANSTTSAALSHAYSNSTAPPQKDC